MLVPYINDLTHHISNAEVVLFADDTNILVIDKNKITLQEKIKKGDDLARILVF
jgi:hypothetical protein